MTLLALLLSCAGPDDSQRDGTFVGNPGLTARYVDTAEHPGRGGQLLSQELFVHGCDRSDDVALGPAAFSFDGSLSIDTTQLPAGEYCQVFVVVLELTVTFQDPDKGQISVTGRDLDLYIPAQFSPQDGERYVLRLGDATWLAEMAALAQAGDNDVADNPELYQVWLDGLEGRSGVEAWAPDPELDGRADPSDYSASPSGTPTAASGCGENTDYHLAAPIPPASMAWRFPGQSGLGWCEGTVTFGPDLALQQATQLDLSDPSSFQIDYNGWTDCPAGLHCAQVYDSAGAALDGTCTVLAVCDPESGQATVTGFVW